MTDLAPNPLMVSLVQAASQLPILMLAIPAGALADIVDRRRLLLWTNLGMLAASGALAVFQALGLHLGMDAAWTHYVACSFLGSERSGMGRVRSNHRPAPRLNTGAYPELDWI